jgi:hypothetical protein
MSVHRVFYFYRCACLLLCLLASKLFGQAPISLQASARKARTLVGESILIELRQTLRADLDLESVELNRDRTSIAVTPLGGPGGGRILSGKDYIALHHAPPLSGIGRAFRGKAGAAWTSQLNLFDYTRPPPSGRYRIAVSYRYGDSPSSVARANEIEIEVIPAKLLTAHFRWFGGSDARGELAALWAAEDLGKPHWFYQVSHKLDPSAVVSAADVGSAVIPAQAAPTLAHLNDIAGNQYERVAVWTDGARLCWLKIADSGSLGSSSCTDAGLNPRREVRLADPPLQLRGGGLAAVLTGEDPSGHPAASFLRVSPEGKTGNRLIPIGAAAAEGASVVWAESEDPVQAALYQFVHVAAGSKVLRTDLASGRQEVLFETPNQVVLVVADQWLGRATVYVLVRRGDAAEIHSWNPASQNSVEFPFPTAWKPVEAVPLANGRGLALLGRTPEGWAVVTRRERWTGTSSSPLHLIASPGGLFLIQHDTDRGFRILREFAGE